MNGMPVSFLDQIRQDILYLAGRLEHRAAHSRQERDAALYIEKRLREHCPNVAIEDFHTVESPFFLFALFYGEFVIAAILGIWVPLIAFIYGGAIFIAYLAEFMGYHIFTRFLPPYESQNVVARFYAPAPRKQFVVMAHYDSGAATPMTHPNFIGFWRPVHHLLIFCMVLVLATLAEDAITQDSGRSFEWSNTIRWCAATVLGLAAAFLFYNNSNAEDIRGANGNASGVAALLTLAKRFQEEPLQHADVWLVFTGSQEIWMSGAQHFFSSHTFDKENTYVLNMECLGAGRLHFLQREGMLTPTKASTPMLEAVERVLNAQADDTSTPHSAFDGGAPTPAELYAIPTAAHIPMTRGFKTLTLMGLDDTYLPLHWNWVDDNMANVDERRVAHSADFADRVLRELEKS